MSNNVTVKEDARIIRTKRDLANALEELLKEKSIEDISIKDITDKALISKNTFYNNFNDKNELLVFLFKRYEDELLNEVKPNLDKKFFLTKIFDFKKCIEIIVHYFYTTNLPFSQMILNDTSHVLFYSLNTFIQDMFTRIEINYGNFLTKKVSNNISFVFYAGAFSSTIYFAYLNNLSIDEKTITKDLVKLAYPIVS